MSYDTAYEEFKENGYELLEKQYKNMSTKMIARDKDGYMVEIGYSYFQQGKEPEIFHPSNRFTIKCGKPTPSGVGWIAQY